MVYKSKLKSYQVQFRVRGFLWTYEKDNQLNNEKVFIMKLN